MGDPDFDAVIRGARAVIDNAPIDPAIRVEDISGAYQRGVEGIQHHDPSLSESKARDVLTDKTGKERF